MGSAMAEIGLDLNLCAMKSIGNFLEDAAGDGRTAKLEESVRSLEEEKRKIEAFKRELPMCMQLLSDVIEGLKKELEQCQGSTLGHAFEEFLPTRRSKLDEDREVKLEADCKEKMKWLSSAQLWLDNSSFGINDVHDKNDKKSIEEENERSDPPPEESLFVLQSNSRNEGGSGAFLPFKGLSSATAVARSKTEDEKPVMAVALPNLSLLTPAATAPIKCPPVTEDHHVGGAVSHGLVRPLASIPAAASPGVHLSLQAQHQPPRKARRCWSPELHRRFVLALQQLGGAQVATPKQIREHMKVDGLTNDEVKSHLQKYRLHTRRVPSGASPAANQALVLVGGLWAPPHNYSSSSQQSASHSDSPQSPLHLGGSHRSPSNVAGDSWEEEDGRSEGYSWK